MAKRGGREKEGERKVEGVPSSAKALLGFPCLARCSVGDLAHAGDVGFCGREITSAAKLLAFCSNGCVCKGSGAK